MVIEAPFSFAGSAKRLWGPASRIANPAGRFAVQVLAVFGIMVAWTCVLMWYFCWGLLVVPWRLMRRSQRREKVARLRHEELLHAQRSAGALPARQAAPSGGRFCTHCGEQAPPGAQFCGRCGAPTAN